MRLRPGVISFCILGVALAACGGGGKGGTVLPAAPSPTSSAATKGAGKSAVSFTITIPKATPAGARRPAYVSPATQSMTVSILQGSTSVLSQTVGLTASSTGCTSSLASVTCALTIDLNAGTYTASITTYDGTNGTGNALSTAQNVSFTVAANQNSVVPLSLSGIPASIIAMAANTANSIYVIAEDADGNFIVGAGAPTFTAAKASGSAVAAITQPTSSAPNTISIAPASPAVEGSETIGVTASYPSGQTNGCPSQTACTLATPITVSNNSIAFIDNQYASSLIGFTLPLTSSTQSPTFSITVNSDPDGSIGLNPVTGEVFALGEESPNGFVAVAPPYTSPITNTQAANDFDNPWGSIGAAPNGDVFVPNYDNNTVAMFVPPYTGTAAQISNSMYSPLAAAVDSNNVLYVANDRPTGGITVYAPPYTGTPIVVNTSSTPTSVMASGSTLVVGEEDNVDVFSLPITSGATPIATWSSSYVYGEASDSAGNIWFSCEEFCTDSGDGEVFEYKKPFSSGEAPSVSLPMPASGFSSYYPAGIGFDATGNLYVQNYEGGSYGGGLLEYSGTITSSSKPAVGIESSIFDYSWGMVIAPPQFSVTL